MSLDAIEQQQLRAAQRTRLEQMAHDLKFSKLAEQQQQSEQAQPQHYQQPPAQQPPPPPLAPAVAVLASQGYTQHENELSKDHNDAISSSFQRLSLAIPIDPSNYTFISMFLSRVLNLTQANEILPKDKDLQRKESPTDDEFQFNSSNVRKSTDILPNIAVPNDIWLVDNIQVKDIKIKTNILSEINNISGLSDSENITIDETTLIYYEKLLTAYKVYDVPNRQSIISSYYSNTPSTYSSHSSYIGEQSLKEEDNEDEQSTYAPSTPIDNITESDEFEDTKQIARTNSNQSSAHSQRTHGSSGHSTASNHSSNHVISGPLSSNGHNAYNNGAVLNNNNNNNNNSNNNNGHSNYNNNHNGHTSLPALASKRISGLSQRKRFLALLGQVTHSSGTNSAHHSNISHNSGLFPEDISISTTNSSHSPAITSPTTTIGSYPNDEEHKKQQNLNNLLAKSRIYNKIKRNRESASSLSLSLSFPSSYSNRNSISTTNTTSSNSSRRRSNSSYFPGSSDNGDSKFSSVLSHTATGSAAASIVTSSAIPTSYSPIPLLSISQKAENRKLKHDYYVQLAELMATTKKILDYSMTNNNGGIAASASNSKLMKFMEFIKKKILKFIIIDVFQMIVDYAQLRAFDLFNRP